MISFAIIAPGIDVFGKLATGEFPSAQISLGRFVVQCLLLLPIVIWRKELRLLSRSEALLHGLRGFLIAMATMMFFSALRYLPITDAIAIFFVEPMIVVLLGAWLLGEPTGWRRYLACFVGFIGALFVIQPSFADVGWPALFPLGTAITFSLYLILTRKLALNTDPFAMQFYAGLAGGLTVAFFLYWGEGTGSLMFDPVWPSLNGALLLLGVGVAATISHMLLVFGFQRAPASVLAPFQYLEIISATLFGFLVFGDFPDAYRWLGISIIVASGLFIFWRERQLGKAA